MKAFCVKKNHFKTIIIDWVALEVPTILFALL